MEFASRPPSQSGGDGEKVPDTTGVSDPAASRTAPVDLALPGRGAIERMLLRWLADDGKPRASVRRSPWRRRGRRGPVNAALAPVPLKAAARSAAAPPALIQRCMGRVCPPGTCAHVGNEQLDLAAKSDHVQRAGCDHCEDDDGEIDYCPIEGRRPQPVDDTHLARTWPSWVQCERTRRPFRDRSRAPCRSNHGRGARASRVGGSWGGHSHRRSARRPIRPTRRIRRAAGG